MTPLSIVESAPTMRSSKRSPVQPSSTALQTGATTTGPISGSRKVYLEQGVPVREIMLTPTKHADGRAEENPPLRVYDTSGPYTDSDAVIDLRKGLAPIRAEWIAQRDDVLEADGSRGLNPAAQEARSVERFPDASRRARLRASAGANVTQMHYARRGIITPEMEFVATRESVHNEAYADLLAKQHRGEDFGASIPRVVTP